MNLKEARELAGMSLREVAKETGAHFSTIQHFESGRKKISPALLQRLAELYEVDVKDIKIDNVTRW